MIARTANCDFCSELAGCLENAFDRIYSRDLKSRLLFRSEELVVMPSLGQIADGHLLLLPIQHWTALADLPESLLKEFAVLFAGVSAILKEQYGSCVSFEHGVRPGGSGGCGISHAHLHTVPFPAELDPVDTLRTKFTYRLIEDLKEIGKQSEGMSGYLFYQDSDSRSYMFDAPRLPSQYMRRVLAEALGTNDWDWRSAGREDRLVATVNRLSNYFEGIGVLHGSQKTHGNPG